MTQADLSDGVTRPPKGSGVLRGMLQARHNVKLGQGGAPQLPQPPAQTPARAAATAVGRAADRLYGLAVQPLSVQPGALTLAELPELLPDLPLVAVLQGPGENLGAIALCPQTVAALIEVQALGRVTSRPVERRRPTRSDAMLCADFINLLLTELPVELEGMEGFEAIAGYRFMTYLEDARPLSLMLEDRPYRSLALDLRLGAGEHRDGQVLLALPQSPPTARPHPEPAAPPSPQIALPEPPAPRARPTLQPAMQDVPVKLVGVLCRRTVTLAELRALTQGRLLHLPRACLHQATLETTTGQVLAQGKLGEAEGCHAIRLRDPAEAIPEAETGGPDLDTLLHAAQAPVDLSQPDVFRMSDEGAGALIAFGAADFGS
ncbi:MAG: FliM/FliN family flagellar motor switch protein [Alphaproteobacteria bacterium]|nr:FliM/FliN family flagellar motor switch protein [Alphaproteobacteria bacterium]